MRLTRHFDISDLHPVVHECLCNVEGIVVDGVAADDFLEVWLAFWTFGHKKPGCTCWRCRLKHIWHIITKGQPYADMVSLSPTEARKLAATILKAADKLEEVQATYDL